MDRMCMTSPNPSCRRGTSYIKRWNKSVPLLQEGLGEVMKVNCYIITKMFAL